MPTHPTPTTAIRLALEDVTARIAALGDTPEARALKESVAIYESKVHAWPETHPDSDEHETMMKLILALHIAVSKLAHESGH
jgi:hypothetical protein